MPLPPTESGPAKRSGSILGAPPSKPALLPPGVNAVPQEMYTYENENSLPVGTQFFTSSRPAGLAAPPIDEDITGFPEGDTEFETPDFDKAIAEVKMFHERSQYTSYPFLAGRSRACQIRGRGWEENPYWVIRRRL